MKCCSTIRAAVWTVLAPARAASYWEEINLSVRRALHAHVSTAERP